MAYELIQEITVGAGGVSSIEFASIPQDGVDLVLVASLRSGIASFQDNSQLRFNNVGSGDPYNSLELRGDGSNVATNKQGFSNWIRLYAVTGASATANTFSSQSIHISNYTSSSVKLASVNMVSETNGVPAYQYITAFYANITDPITSIQLDESTVFQEHSTVSLYKIY